MVDANVYEKARRTMLINAGLIHPWDMVQVLSNHNKSNCLNTNQYAVEYKEENGSVEDEIIEKKIKTLKGIRVHRNIKHISNKGIIDYRLFKTYVFNGDVFNWSCSCVNIDYSFIPEKERPCGCKEMSFYMDAFCKKRINTFTQKLFGKSSYYTDSREDIPEDIEAYLLNEPISHMVLSHRIPSMFSN